MDRAKFDSLINDLGVAKNSASGMLFQQPNEWWHFLSYVENLFSERQVSRPLVVEIGSALNAQKRFYTELLGAEHIGIDICDRGAGCPDIAGDSNDENTLKRLKGIIGNGRIDLLFIDGDHSFASVKKDYELYAPFTRHIIALHDVNLRTWGDDFCEVPYFWDRIVETERDALLMTFQNAMTRPGQLDLTGIGAVIRNGRAKISIVTKWLNEEDLAPFFLAHYAWADEIIVLLDTRTDDHTEEIIAGYPNARIIPVEYPEGFNCIRAIDRINEVAGTLNTDWIICVDADEFVFPHGGGDVREALLGCDDVVYADMWQVYRHKTEIDLDPTIPVMNARRFGDPDRDGMPNRLYKKPCIIRAGCGIEWEVGCHYFHSGHDISVSKTRFDGAHWAMADAGIAIKRRKRFRREVLSRDDVERQFSSHNYDITNEQIIRICKQHLNDPQLF